MLGKVVGGEGLFDLLDDDDDDDDGSAQARKC